MARPERNSVDYFPFYCEEGKKMFYIEQTYGNDGFAVFVKLLRELAKTEYHYLDLRDETTLMFLSAKCRVKTELMTAIINDLVKLNKFHKELWEQHKIIWCQDFIDSIQDAYIRRNNKCITFDGLCIKLSIKCNTKTKLKLKNNDNNTQSKVEYIIEEEIKEEKEIINNNIFNFKNSLKQKGADEELIAEWLKIRKLKKATNSEIAFNSFIEEVEKSKKPINEILEICIINSWKGFKNEWIINKIEIKNNPINRILN